MEVNGQDRKSAHEVHLWLKIDSGMYFVLYEKDNSTENDGSNKNVASSKIIGYLKSVADPRLLVCTRERAAELRLCPGTGKLSESGFLEFTVREHTTESLKEHVLSGQSDADRNERMRDFHPDAKTLLPTLHWSVCDLFGVGETPLSKVMEVPRYVKYLDSSIWHYYYPFFSWGSEPDKISGKTGDTWCPTGLDRLLRIFDQMYRNACRGLYTLSNAQEFYELNKRLMREAYLAEMAHGQAVSPFVFHSEYEARNLIEQGRSDFAVGREGRTDLFGGTKWRILLVDDHANMFLKDTGRTQPLPLQPPYDAQNSHWNEEIRRTRMCPMGKLQIVYDQLLTVKKDCKIIWSSPGKADLAEIERQMSVGVFSCPAMHWNEENGADCSQGDFDLAIVCAHDVRSAMLLLKYERFDIVLLDYLLGSGAQGREYSYNLLKDIESQKTNVPKSEEKSLFQRTLFGPNSRLFFLHISAFIPAISERLQEQMLSRDTAYWHIARGACPINTPQQFLYYFFSLMNKRYTELIGKDGTLVALLYGIFGASGDSGTGFIPVKNNAVNRFNDLLELRRKYDVLRRYDVEREDAGRSWQNRRGSLLVYSLLPDMEVYSNSFWEHIKHLVYLVAFGTVRQWPEMWEEYMFVRERLDRAEAALPRQNTGQSLTEMIENYIVGLKNA